jgi:Asp-tRNA(Asn)/Glu-tRNA(Gln) amidotransferase C subunit
MSDDDPHVARAVEADFNVRGLCRDSASVCVLKLDDSAFTNACSSYRGTVYISESCLLERQRIHPSTNGRPIPKSCSQRPDKTQFDMASRYAFLRTKCLFTALQPTHRRAFPCVPLSARRSSSTQAPSRKGIHPDELETLLAEPTWSVESLLPPKTRAPDAPQITSRQLHHLLRLSALPPPATPEEEQKMLDTLAAQLHFVGKIQEVDTAGVEPLRAIRDETAAAEEEQTISVSTLMEALNSEKVVGTHYKRIQRDTAPIDTKEAEDWDVLGSAERKSGKYFVVESERPQE